MSRRGKFNKAFASSFNTEEKKSGVPYALLKSARHSGQLNISGRTLDEVPASVWRINLDVPDEAKNASIADTDERWWDQIDLKKLILASNQLKSIPDDIKHLPALNVLDAHDNAIEHISDELSKLQDLVKIHLSHNKLVNLPDSLCNIASLKVFLLAGNLLEQLPKDFGYLCNVEELDLCENKLTLLPESFGNLKQLKKLNLSKNQLNALPDSFDNLTKLQDLNVSSNKLKGLSKGFGKLTSLEMLDASYNQILNFTSFEDPAKIKHLFLGYNKIQKIEEDVFEKLPYLVSISLRDNAISVIPDSFTSLKLIERVDLSNNSLSGLPYVIGNMDLKALTLDGNSMRTIRRDVVARGTQAILDYLKSRIPVELEADKKLPAQDTADGKVVNTSEKSTNNSANDVVHESSEQKKKIHETSQAVVDQYVIATTKVLTHSSASGELPNSFWLPGAKITNIVITHNALTEYPSQIANYAETLSELDISHNKLSIIPPSIGILNKLAYLNLSHNALAEFPDDINQLKHLLQVTLSFNKFATIPECLFTCPQLQTILIANNKITEINVAGLLKLKTLHTLDLSNNNISRIPPELGNVDWLKSLTLDGNCFRQPRPQILTQGTQFILGYLRDRIPT